MKKADYLIINSSSLITLAGPKRPRAGKEMQELGIIKNGAVAVKEGKILEADTTEKILKRYKNCMNSYDAENRLVMPGFVDCHTHLVYGGSRENELFMRLKGKSYLDILEQGGGIHSTVRSTREAEEKSLLYSALKRLNSLLLHGTTTVEIKSGYGLNLETELKILRVINELDKKHLMDVVPTFLGAHAIPKNTDRSVYLNWLINEALAESRPYAEFCDVFCEKGAFTLEESKKILNKALELGYSLKIHSGQFNALGATGLAASLNAVSADHLENINPEEMDKLKKSGTIGVLLPGVPFFLLSDKYPDARELIQKNIPIALATDFNPGSCPSYSMQMMIALAVLKMKLSIEEALIAATINSAYSIKRGELLGSLESGKQADIIIMDITNPGEIPYYFGTNLVSAIMKKGKFVKI